jgi:hypothetical protein
MSDAEIVRDNHGYLLRVQSKRHEKGPDMEGEAWVNGEHYNLAGWVNVSKKGGKYLNLKFTLSAKRELSERDC